MPWFVQYLIFYLCIINIIAVAVTVHDKLSAIRSHRRVRERTLFLLSLSGGGLCMYITMLLIRHKTKHLSFMIGIPVIVIFELTMLITAHFILAG